MCSNDSVKLFSRKSTLPWLKCAVHVFVHDAMHVINAPLITLEWACISFLIANNQLQFHACHKNPSVMLCGVTSDTMNTSMFSF